jgi:hypothetical protein
MNPYLRLGLVIVACAYFWHYALTYTQWHFIDIVNLIFHEAGHTIFFFLGDFIRIAAGSGFQVALPLFITCYFFYTKQKISGVICLMWVGQNLLNVSVYAGDAIKMQLDLLGGDGVIHDWNYLLSTLNILKYTPAVASSVYWLGLLIIFTGTFLALYYSWPTNKESLNLRALPTAKAS